MSVRCKNIQQALAAGTNKQLGTDALLQKHLKDCDECSALKTALERVDESLAALPSINPPLDLIDRMLVKAGSHPVPVQLVHSQPDKPELGKVPSPERVRETRMGRTLAMGSAFAAAAAIALVSASSFFASNSTTSPVPQGATAATATAVNKPVSSTEIDNTLFQAALGKANTAERVQGVASLSEDGKMGGKGRLPSGNRFALLETKATGDRLQGDYQGADLDENNLKEARRLEVLRVLGHGQKTKPVSLARRQLVDAFAELDVLKTPEVVAVAPEGHEVTVTNTLEDAIAKSDQDGRLESLRRDATQDPSADPTELIDEIETISKTGKVEVQKGSVAHPSKPRASEKRIVDARKGKGKGEEEEEEGGERQLDWWRSAGRPTYYRYLDADANENGRDSSESVVNETTREFKSQLTVDGSKHDDATEGVVEDVEKELERGEQMVNLPKQSSAKQNPPKHSSLARAFIAERSKHVRVPTVSANGFWSNNYIPADPRLRLLAASLIRDPHARDLGSLDATVTPNPQSFDAPNNSALAVTVRSDRHASDGPARMLLQVGIKGTARQAGRRPALNIGVVLELANTIGEAEATQMRALISALRVAKRSGDKFSLTVANRPGGLMVSPKQFRNGPLRVAMQSLFSEEPATQSALSLAEAVAVATTQVAATDDSNGPLGRSLVLVVTASASTSDVNSALEGLAHTNATNGIGLSTVGVGTEIDDDQLLRWAVAGHGNRRLLARRGDAQKLIASELASAESVVARAVRVRVKLASGVKLVEVVGAHRLGAAAAARTQETEKSIDRRVAKARGITSDRERDEEGVKIIIPSFSAGDSHVILLDVIVDGPGAVADVAVTYKDLVHLRNGSANSSLSLRRGRNKLGHFERSVFQNYVGLVISERLSAAGMLLSKSDSTGAARVLKGLDDLLRGLGSEISWLRKDAGFGRDAKAVAKFRDVLQDGVSDAAKAYVANSLSYAAWRKIVRVRREPN